MIEVGCIDCQAKFFRASTLQVRCPTCQQEHRRTRDRGKHLPHKQEYMHKYNIDNREKIRTHRQLPEVKERTRLVRHEYNQRSEVKKRAREYQNKRRKTPEGIEYDRNYRQRPDVKERVKINNHEYKQHPENKERALILQRKRAAKKRLKSVYVLYQPKLQQYKFGEGNALYRVSAARVFMGYDNVFLAAYIKIDDFQERVQAEQKIKQDLGLNRSNGNGHEIIRESLEVVDYINNNFEVFNPINLRLIK